MKTRGLLLPWEVDTRDGDPFVRVVTQPKSNKKRDIVCVFPMMMDDKKKRRYAETIVAAVNTLGVAQRLGDRLWKELSQRKTSTFTRELWNLADALRDLTE